MDCTKLSSYRGDPVQLFQTCCPNSTVPTRPLSSAPILDCPRFAGIPSLASRISENLVTCTYSPSPLWASRNNMPSGSPGRAAACDFLGDVIRGSPEGATTVVHLSGETNASPGFLARWRGFRDLDDVSPAEFESCSSASARLQPAYLRYMRARVRAEAGALLPILGNEIREAPDTYAQHFGGPAQWQAQIQQWQARLNSDLSRAATELRTARSVAMASCFPIQPRNHTGHVGAYGRTMGELLTAGLDSVERPSHVNEASTEDPLLNAEGIVMCAGLPGKMLTEPEGKLGALLASDSALRTCYQGLDDSQVAQLRQLLGGENPRVLDAFRLVRSWQRARGAGEECEKTTAILHKTLHNLAVFYHASPFFTRFADLPESCRMSEAERRDTSAEAPVSFPGPFGACEVGVKTMCERMPNLLDARANGLGHGVLKQMVSPQIASGEFLSVKGEPVLDGDMNVALARALAAHRHRACDIDQWSGTPTGSNFCFRDEASSWLVSRDPGRNACGRAVAMVRDTPLNDRVANFPSRNDPYCPDTEACCCDASHLVGDVQICRLTDD
jgi:hypothetical protein